MSLSHRVKVFFLVVGDIIALYLALLATLYVRYRSAWLIELTNSHLLPFSIIFVLWLTVFYVAGLYDLRRLRNNLEFLKMLNLTIAANAALAVAFFYLIPVFGITPKTNLFVFLVIYEIIAVLWRRSFNRWTALSQPLAYITLVGESPAMRELYEFLGTNPQLGFKIRAWISESELRLEDGGTEPLRAAVQNGPTELLVVSRDLRRDPRLAKLLYELFANGLSIHDVPSFYEEVFRKIPINEITEEWFFDKIAGHHRFYDGLKRAAEAIMALLMLIVLSPVFLLIGLLVTTTSSDAVICAQIRIGRRGRPYTHYKFRTMKSCTEKDGPKWKQGGNRDPRLTWIGRFLAPSHLDELPQLVNILKGELSFVGPRPERPAFVEMLRREIPYYDVRHIVNPGITGWAQINYHYGSSVQDAAEKLRYDLYYIKNRSPIIDVAIVIKTVKTFFSNPE
ncbi:MAG: exopolysaccharide biosynthesis polyprenyl glycosylphosphotransferase [Candidatus Liptonbacteria bacterium]